MDPIKKIFVQGGEVVVSNSPSELVTILGSCVAVCLWDRKLKVGGMNHYLLPGNINQTGDLNNGLMATKMLIQSMLKQFACIKNLEAKIFGGGNRFFSHSFLSVGPQNVDVAKTALDEAGIPIVLDDIGGIAGRKIYFNTQTGNVAVSLIV